MESGDSIQIDKGGFLRIHNAIFELLAKAPLRGQQFRCLMFLFRKTYGFNKKENKISLKEWAAGTGLQRQNVWRELQLLIKCNVIYMKSSGEKRANIWGFNKHHEQWKLNSVVTDDYSSVVSDDDNSVVTDDYSVNDSVVTDDYSSENSVITSDYKSVITPPHTRELKDSKDKSSLLAATDSDDAMGLVRLAYQTACKIGPPTATESGRANLIAATNMIERFGYAACVRGLSTLKERNDAMIKKNRRGIAAPVAYLRTILEDDLGVLITAPAPATVNFALEDITQ